ncbi:MAG: enoyl-ACP reductase FabI [Caulobacterales bacterium]|nr:enoyl-ACP reductase FabI [Caulobacterales bacterium]
MTDTAFAPALTTLTGKRGLVVGVANADSIAAGCARAFAAAGADLALTYLNEKALPHVRPVAEAVEAAELLPLNVEDDGQLDAVFERIAAAWGRLDFLLHAIAYCPKEALHGPVSEVTRADFARAMDVSCHSLIRMTRRAAPLMTEGGAILTVSYYGAEKVVDHYNIMGPVKAALETSARYLAAELGPAGVRVNTLSPGPMRTRAASGIAHFDELLEEARRRAPKRRLVTLEDVGAAAAFYVSDAARNITGDTVYIDAGHHVMS